MGLENLQSVFTVGLQEPSSTNVTQLDSSLDNLSSYAPTNMIDLTIPNTNSYQPLSLAELAVSNQLTFPVLDTLQFFDMGGAESPATKLYDTYTYDPRTAKPGTGISKNPYTGTLFDDGLGGLFNSVEPYSNAFATINTPKGYFSSEGGNDIVHFGNITNNGGGYPQKQPLLELYRSSKGIPKSKYVSTDSPETINTDRTIVDASIPKFNDLINTNGLDAPLTITDSYGNNHGSRLAETTWEKLYNSDHTSKDEVGYSYGPNVNRGKLNIKDTNGVNSPSRGGFIGANGEPYIVSEIGKGAPAGGLFSSRMFPIARAITDAERVANYVTSPDGIFKMSLMGNIGNALASYLSGVHKYQAFYNPASSIFASISRFAGTSPFAPINRNFPFQMKDKYIGSNIGSMNPRWGTSNDLDIGTGRGYATGSTPLLQNINPLTSFGKPSEFAVRKTSKISADKTEANFKGISGDPHTLADLVRPNKTDPFPDTPNNISKTLKDDASDINTLMETVDKGLPFYFKDLRDATYVVFRAYLDTITDEISPSWNETSYVGRSEPVYIYENATREINFNLKLYANNRHELRQIYKKMNRLTSFCYPEYKQDSQITQYKAERMKPPLIQLRLGDLFGSANALLTGFLSSLTYTFPDEATWEHEVGYRVPKYVQATINFKVIHDEAPSGNRFSKSTGLTGLNFYGINEKAGVG